jgi:hypothetical protein
MELPTKYTKLSPRQKRLVRLEYIKLQNGKCYHCGESLGDKPSAEVMGKYIDTSLFPPNFFTHPIHLHHNHETGMTIGTVHCQCNAVLWQYYGE